MSQSAQTDSRPDDVHELTVLIERAAGQSDLDAQAELMDVLYARLRAMAGRQARMGSSETLRATALVNEAYMRLFGRGAQRFDDRDHFFAAVATVMRQIAVDRARRIRAAKRGGDRSIGSLDAMDVEPAAARTGADASVVIDLDRALERLAEDAPRQARVVELRFFAGCSVQQAADVLGVSPRTIELDWRAARARLRLEMAADPDAPSAPDAGSSSGGGAAT